jgi:hypothetical protein
MKVNMKMIRKMARAHLLGKAGMFTKVAIKMMKEMDMERCIGLMVHNIKVNGRKEYNTVLVK